MGSVKLPSGSVVPLNGFGTWRADEGTAVGAVRAALEAGYRHIDCAAIYCNEAEVGEVFEEYFGGESPKVRREEVFITSKVWNSCHSRENVLAACRQTLKDLQLEYLDLYLVHFPLSWEFGGLPITEDNWVQRDEKGAIRFTRGVTLQETWGAMEEVHRLGLAKNIGISNYSTWLIMDLLNYCTVPPAVNQCECHLLHQRADLRDICATYGIHFTAYSVLGSGKQGPMQHPAVRKMADKYQATPAQICTAWALAQGISALTKSVSAKRIKENFDAGKIRLSPEDLQELAKLEQGLCTCDPKEYWGFAALS